MRSLMKWVWPALLVLSAIVLIGAYAATRHEMTPAGSPRPSGPALEAAAQAEPQSANKWMGYAEADQSIEQLRTFGAVAPKVARGLPEPGTMSPGEAYAKALAMQPTSAAIAFRKALCDLSPLAMRQMQAAATMPSSAAPNPSPLAELGTTPVPPADQAALRRIRGEFAAAARLDPDNAAPVYFLARVDGRLGDKAAMLADLRAAVGKKSWSLYDAQVGTALVELAQAAGFPPAQLLLAGPGSTNEIMPLRDLARSVADMAGEYRRAGDQKQAVFCISADIHLGHLMRWHAFEAVDGLTGIAVTAIAATPMLSQDRAAALRAQPTAQVGRDAVSLARTSALVAYLQSQGRQDLADNYIADVAAARQFRDESKKIPKGAMPRLLATFYGGGMSNAIALWVLTAAMAIIGLLLGLIWLLSGGRRQPTLESGPGFGSWLVLMLVCLLPGQMAALVATIAAKGDNISDTNAHVLVFAVSLAAVGGILGAVLWALCAGVLGARQHAAGGAGGLSAKATVFAVLRRLMLPALVVLFFLSAYAFGANRSNAKALNSFEQNVMTKGDVQVYKIGPVAAPPMPAPGGA